jgi:hypothetical protein
MYKNKSGSDIDKKLEMLEGMKSELDAYQNVYRSGMLHPLQ